LYSLFIGRWQVKELHEGHRKLIGTVLAEGKPVVIAVRDTKISEKNPYTVQERICMIRKEYAGNPNVRVITIPDIAEVIYGRDVGWSIREIRLDSDTEAISATKVRGNEATKRGEGFALWFTGLPSSGKSTIADAVTIELKKSRAKVMRLDADVIRQKFWPELGYSKEDRDKNITRATQLAAMLIKSGVVVIASFISPYQDMRAFARREIGNFIEIYVRCPVAVCIQRDTRGLYKKALAGEITNFTGISDPYEEPLNPDVLIESDKETIEDSVNKIMAKIDVLRL